MKTLKLGKAFTLMEPGPVVLVTTNDGRKDNVMTVSWTMVIGFSPAFALTPVKARHVRAPLVKECLANIECRVVDIVKRHDIVVLEGVAAYFDSARAEKRMIHAVGDGTFIVDGRRIDRRKMMRSKLPDGL